MLAARPLLVDVAMRADEIWPELWANGRKTLTHAGAPIPWARMCDPMKGTMIGAMLYEGWARAPEEAAERLARGEVEFLPNHDIGAVGPMSGAISPSMPVFVVRNATHGNLAYTNFSEGIGRVLRFGAYGPDVIERLKWIAAVIAPPARGPTLPMSAKLLFSASSYSSSSGMRQAGSAAFSPAASRSAASPSSALNKPERWWPSAILVAPISPAAR